MNRMLTMTSVIDGVLLSRFGEVHHDTGSRRTRCGLAVPPGKSAAVNQVQAVVFKLPLCGFCFPVSGGGR